MRVVYKYKLNVDETKLYLSEDYKVLLVAIQFNEMCIWIEVLEEPTVLKSVTFSVRLTGVPFQKGTHVGSFLEDGDSAVWHVYMVQETT